MVYKGFRLLKCSLGSVGYKLTKLCFPLLVWCDGSVFVTLQQTQTF